MWATLSLGQGDVYLHRVAELEAAVVRAEAKATYEAAVNAAAQRRLRQLERAASAASPRFALPCVRTSPCSPSLPAEAQRSEGFQPQLQHAPVPARGDSVDLGVHQSPPTRQGPVRQLGFSPVASPPPSRQVLPGCLPTRPAPSNTAQQGQQQQNDATKKEALLKWQCEQLEQQLLQQRLVVEAHIRKQQDLEKRLQSVADAACDAELCEVVQEMHDHIHNVRQALRDDGSADGAALLQAQLLSEVEVLRAELEQYQVAFRMEQQEVARLTRQLEDERSSLGNSRAILRMEYGNSWGSPFIAPGLVCIEGQDDYQGQHQRAPWGPEEGQQASSSCNPPSTTTRQGKAMSLPAAALAKHDKATSTDGGGSLTRQDKATSTAEEATGQWSLLGAGLSPGMLEAVVAERDAWRARCEDLQQQLALVAAEHEHLCSTTHHAYSSTEKALRAMLDLGDASGSRARSVSTPVAVSAAGVGAVCAPSRSGSTCSSCSYSSSWASTYIQQIEEHGYGGTSQALQEAALARQRDGSGSSAGIPIKRKGAKGEGREGDQGPCSSVESPAASSFGALSTSATKARHRHGPSQHHARNTPKAVQAPELPEVAASGLETILRSRPIDAQLEALKAARTVSRNRKVALAGSVGLDHDDVSVT